MQERLHPHPDHQANRNESDDVVKPFGPTLPPGRPMSATDQVSLSPSPTTGSLPPARVRRRLNRRTGAVLRGVGGVVGLMVIVEIISRAGIVNEAFLPPFSRVLVTTFGLLGQPSFLLDIGSTLLTWVLGLTISTVVAVTVGISFGLSKIAYTATRSIIDLIRPMPAIALIPLSLLVIGQGLSMKLFIALFAAIWPILFNTIYGVQGVDQKLRDMGRVFGLSRVGVIGRIVLPAAAPFVATGIRMSSSIVLIVIITVEFMAPGAQTDGLGIFIAMNKNIGTADATVLVYCGVLVAGFLGLAINSALGWAERRWLGWDATTKGEM